MNQTLRERAFQYCQDQVGSRIAAVLKQMEDFQQAANEETKSSVGDKYETGRALMQLEKEKSAGQLHELMKMKKVLDEIKIGRQDMRVRLEVRLGSLVRTNRGFFFLSVSLGKVSLDDFSFFAISPVAPIGKLLSGKAEGDVFSFNGTEYRIESISQT